jgi:urea transport system ATP-binding protein
MLTVQNLSVAYGGSRVVREVSLEVPARRVVCLMGRNGVGKTTTLRCPDGAAQAGRRIHHPRRRDAGPPAHPGAARSTGVRLCAPGPRHLRDLDRARENLQERRSSRKRRKLNVAEVLDRVLQLVPRAQDQMLKRKGGVLSGGQQQQLAIARALLTETEAS